MEPLRSTSAAVSQSPMSAWSPIASGMPFFTHRARETASWQITPSQCDQFYAELLREGAISTRTGTGSTQLDRSGRVIVQGWQIGPGTYLTVTGAALLRRCRDRFLGEFPRITFQPCDEREPDILERVPQPSAHTHLRTVRTTARTGTLNQRNRLSLRHGKRPKTGGSGYE